MEDNWTEPGHIRPRTHNGTICRLVDETRWALYGCGTPTDRAGHFDNGTEANGGEGGI